MSALRYQIPSSGQSLFALHSVDDCLPKASSYDQYDRSADEQFDHVFTEITYEELMRHIFNN